MRVHVPEVADIGSHKVPAGTHDLPDELGKRLIDLGAGTLAEEAAVVKAPETAAARPKPTKRKKPDDSDN